MDSESVCPTGLRICQQAAEICENCIKTIIKSQKFIPSSVLPSKVKFCHLSDKLDWAKSTPTTPGYLSYQRH